jgi:hypothetical protein
MSIEKLTVLGTSEAFITMLFDILESNEHYYDINLINNLNITPIKEYLRPKFNVTETNQLENINDKYLSPEMYILSNNNCKYISLANDTNNILINEYKFPDEITIEKNKTTEFIIIHNHLNLMNLCE